ncbi:hypothetical protein CANARDRAFT_194865 [[Candida] arabinofermentans NRRL YB-2248]|uniref:Uncharacterized protein n=1 Tax=[Candida] arabinofermentans NRRL YB-2248 TaxID=983967 RepID=A0A1E4T5P8_9ASCO|nr:hypothetical protein CANARDRAFT_194865 [[Candida] arabinofermentans NRRL YB-2248]
MSDIPVARITTYSNNGSDYVLLGHQRFNKNDLVAAFGGTLQPGVTYRSTHSFGNPAPLGLCSFALTTFVLSLINAGAMGVKHDNIVVGLAMFYGGFIQLLAGMWEIALENTFGGLALSSFGGFWLSFGAISIPWFGIASSYDDPIELDNAVGFYLLGWTVFTFILCLATCKSTIPFFSLFVCLDITFLCLTLGKLAQSPNCTKAGGIFGIITAFLAYYNAMAGLMTSTNSYFVIRPWNLPKFGKAN